MLFLYQVENCVASGDYTKLRRAVLFLYQVEENCVVSVLGAQS